MKETRVGYMAVDRLYDIVKDHIEFHTRNGRYEDDPHYLSLCKQYADYLKTKQGDEK